MAYRYTIDTEALKLRYDKIAQIISDLEDLQLTMIANGGDAVSYSLDTGQTRISTTYKTHEQISMSIEAYERILERIANKITGTRIIRLADAETIQSIGRF